MLQAICLGKRNYIFFGSDTLVSTTKTYLFTPHLDRTNCLYALVRIRYQDLCPGTPVHVRQSVDSAA